MENVGFILSPKNNLMNARNIFAYTLSGLVLAITIMALLAIWGIIDWEYLSRYFGKTIQSLVIIVISAVVIYLIQSLLFKQEIKKTDDRTSA